MSHSRYSPSSYERWSECPGSLNLLDAHPELKNTSSKYAEEGTIAHQAAELWLQGQEPKDPNHLKYLKPYVDYCTLLLAQGGPCWTEFRVGIPDTEVWGTMDFICLVGSTLHIVDLKYGSGVPVDVEGNTQLKIYALGALLSLPECSRATQVQITIVQPRCYHPDGPIRSEVIDSLELLEFLEEVEHAVRRTQDPSAPFSPGDHCRWCAVQTVCSAFGNRASVLARKAFEPIERSGDPSDLSELSDSLKGIPIIEAWIKSIREKAYLKAMKGEKIPGFKLVEKRAHRKWLDEDQLPIVLEKTFGISYLEMFEKSLKSPAQMEKLISPDQRKQLNAYVKQESSGAALVSETDPRPAVIATTAREVFTAIEHVSE